jgi:HlyD family secretion protein
VREPGEIVGAGEVVYSAALDDPVWVRAYVDEPDLGKVGPGQEARISTDLGRVYPGQVGFISPRAEFTPRSVETGVLRTELVYRMRIVVENGDGALRQGMPVTVSFPKGGS